MCRVSPIIFGIFMFLGGQLVMATSLIGDVASIEKVKNWDAKVKILIKINSQFDSDEKILRNKIVEADRTKSPELKKLEEQYVDLRVPYYEFKPIIDAFSDLKKSPTSDECQDVADQVRFYDLMGATDDQELSADAELALTAVKAFCSKK